MKNKTIQNNTGIPDEMFPHMKPHHTPTPWWINRTNGSDNEICSGPSGLDAESQSQIVTVAVAHGPQGEWGKVGPEHEANAAFIVKAVNSHEALYDVKTFSKNLLKVLKDRFARTGCNSTEEMALNCLREAIAKSEANS